MSWEWVGPVATAAVGLAGIAATWFSARLSRGDQRQMILVQQQHATEMALQEMRRNAYATFISNVYSMTAVSADTNDQAAADRVLAAAHDLARSLAEVRILGSDAIGELAGQVTDDTLRFRVKHLEAIQKGTAVDEEAGKAMGDRRSRLEHLMAVDLGIKDKTSPGKSQNLTAATNSDVVGQPPISAKKEINP
jgi:hypothetical protein